MAHRTFAIAVVSIVAIFLVGGCGDDPQPEPTPAARTQPAPTAAPAPTTLPTDTPVPPPGSVQNLEAVKVAEDSITLQWKPPANSNVVPVERYEVTRDVSFGRDEHDFVAVTTFTDVGLRSGAKHKYGVRAIGAGGAEGVEVSIEVSTSGSPTPEPSPTPTPVPTVTNAPVPTAAPTPIPLPTHTPVPPPGSVQNLEAVKVTEDSITLQWKPPANSNVVPVERYEVTRNVSLGRDEHHFVVVTTFTDMGLRSGAKHKYRVKAIGAGEVEGVEISIEVSTSSSLTPEPSPTATPAPEPTPVPTTTSTPVPTATLTPEPTPTLEPTSTPVPTPEPPTIEELGQVIIEGIKGYPEVRDAAISQDEHTLSLVLVVAQATSQSRAQQLGDNFVRMTKTLLQDGEAPGQQIGRGEYDYLIGVYRPNEERIALGAKSRVADRISWR